MKKNLLFSLLLCLGSLSSWAQTFTKVDGIRYLIEDDHAVVARQDKELTGDIVIPASIMYNEVAYNVTRLIRQDDAESGGGGAFQECEITTITLPESITEIPSATFWNCKQLSSVTLLGPVTSIGGSAFEWCEALTTIDLPKDVTEICQYAFHGAGLTEFKIPVGVTKLDYYALADTKITYLEIPETLNDLGECCFATNMTDEYDQPLKRTIKMFQRDCRHITEEISFGDMTQIDLLVPAGSKALYQEYYPWMYMNSITEYGEDMGETLVPDQRHVTIDGIAYMLKDGEAYVDIQPETLGGEVTIPAEVTYEGNNYPVTKVMGSYWASNMNYDGLNAIHYYHFSGAFTKTQVTKVTLPASIKSIGHNAFDKAQKLQELVLNEGLTEIGERAFNNCPELTTINIPSTVAILPRGMLRYCSKLSTLTLNEGITCIDWEALYDTGLETLTLPSTCKLLGYQALQIPNLKTLHVNMKEPTDIKAIDYNDQPATMNGTVFGHDSEQEATRERLSRADLIVPLGCAESYKVQAPWFNFRSVTDEGSPYLKLNNSVFSAPEGKFDVAFPETMAEDEKFEYHDGWYEETYTHGLNLKDGVKVSFKTESTSWVYVYLFSSNSNTIKLDGVEITNSEIGDDQSGTYSYRRYDKLVEGAGEHTITCNTYEGNQWPCMFLLRVQNVSGDYYQPKTIGVNIDGINYVLHETVNEQEETVRTATIARQNTSLSGDIVIPAKVSYAKTVLQDNNWVTLDAYDYDVIDMVAPGFEIDEAPGIHRTTDGAFQECQMTSISLPATITVIPAGTFNGCQQLKSVTLAEGITTIGAGAFANCANLEEIYLPETITDMSGWYIFGNCPSLKKVNIPKQVTQLGNGTFMGSGIETFLIPKTLTGFGEACFDANHLKSIKICHETYSDGSISFPENAFTDVSGITLIVPESTKESLYSQVYPWKNFEDIIEYTDQNDEHQYNAYSVNFEQEIETPAASRGHKSPAATPFTAQVDWIPSGVSFSLPERIEKNGVTYIVEPKDAPSTMPAKDLVVKAAFTEVGDADKNGVVNIVDVTSSISKILGQEPEGFFDKAADVNGDNKVDIVDVTSIIDIILKAK